MNLFVFLFFTLSLSLSSLAAPTYETVFRWVHFEDLKSFPLSSLTRFQIQEIENELHRTSPPSLQIYNEIQSIRFNTFFERLPHRSQLAAEVLVTYGQNRKERIFTVYQAVFDSHGTKLLRLSPIRSIPLSQAQFKVRVGLEQLKVLIEDPVFNIRFLYPISSPGFDLGKSPRSLGRNIFLIPMIEGTVSRKVSQERRTDPPYYKGKPFLRILPYGHTWSLYGFHISPWTDQLERGFYSSGCLRLKEDDLLEFYDLLAAGANSEIPIKIDYQIKENDEHPYPKILDSYYALTYFSFREGRMKFNTSLIRQPPPLSRVDRYHGFWPANSPDNSQGLDQ